MTAKRAAARDRTPALRRKNFELDQNRIDRVKEALGARTETEAITRAMDVALKLAEFADEVRRGSAHLFGKGGFVDRFDDERSLDFSGFKPPSSPAPRRAPGARKRTSEGR